MKINSWYRSSFVLIAMLGIPGESTLAQQTNFLRRQYRNFIHDVTLIKNSYLRRSVISTDADRQAVHNAVLRVSAEGLALVALVAGVFAGVHLAYAYPNAPKSLSFYDQLYHFITEDLKTSVAKLNVISANEVEIEPSDIIEDLIKFRDDFHERYPDIKIKILFPEKS